MWRVSLFKVLFDDEPDIPKRSVSHMNSRFSIALLVLLLSVAGCATNPIAAAKSSGIKTVQVEPRVDARQGMRFGIQQPGNRLASIIIDAAGQKGIERMSAVMAEHEIVLPEMVRERLEQKLRAHPELQLRDADAEGILIATIIQYGFSPPPFGVSRKIPFLFLQLELRDANGKKIWRGDRGVNLFVRDTGATWEEYERNPEQLRRDWMMQIDHVLSDLLE
jgi:hypothetical protein